MRYHLPVPQQRLGVIEQRLRRGQLQLHQPHCPRHDRFQTQGRDGVGTFAQAHRIDGIGGGQALVLHVRVLAAIGQEMGTSTTPGVKRP